MTGVTSVMKVVDDWGYVAVVIDRLQLYVFLVVTVLGRTDDVTADVTADVTVVGSAVLLTNAPHIFEFVDQDEIKRRLTSQN